MSCEENLSLSNSWGDPLDSEIVFTGLTVQCELLNIKPGMKLREVISIIASSVCSIQTGDEPISQQIIEDPDLTMETTATELDGKYPEFVNGGVVYNSVQSIQYTKYPTGWKFEVIEIKS